MLKARPYRRTRFKLLVLEDRAWRDTDGERYAAEGCDGVRVLCSRRSVRKVSLEFLRQVPGLRALEIDGPFHDDSVVSELASLESLDLDTTCRAPLRVDGLPRLEQLGVSGGREELVGISQLTNLRRLFLGRWQGTDLRFLGLQPRLEFLKIIGRQQVLSLDGIEGSRGLRQLMIQDAGVASLDPLRELSGLESIYLTNFPSFTAPEPWDLSVLAGSPRLEELRLVNMGSVLSLAPLDSMRGLRRVTVRGAVLDRDMTPLLRLPRTTAVGQIQDDPRHSHSEIEILQARAIPAAEVGIDPLSLPHMGTWGDGPFDNDDAADWADELDETPAGERVRFVRDTLQRSLDDDAVVTVDDHYDVDDVVVAAAVLVASTLSDGPQLSGEGPEPETLNDLRFDRTSVELAARALRSSLADEADPDPAVPDDPLDTRTDVRLRRVLALLETQSRPR